MKKAIALSLLLAATSMQSHALNFEQQGTTVIISGKDIDFPDRGKLIDAIEKGATTLVLREIGGGRTDVTYNLGRIIKEAGITTVIDGYCTGSCPTLFMAGKTRLLARPADQKNPPAMRLQGTVISGTNSAARSTAQYAYYSELFGKGMPFETLNRYTTNGLVGEYLYFSPPSAQLPEGALFDCKQIKDDSGKSSSKCDRAGELTALGVGQLTSVEPFEIPGRAAAAPKYQLKESNLVALTLARNFTKTSGAQGVGTEFTLDGRIYAIASIAWDPQQDIGSHEFQTKWYRNGTLFVSSKPIANELKESPWRFWSYYDAITLGAGSFKVEAYIDGRFLGSKSFTISETDGKAPELKK